MSSCESTGRYGQVRQTFKILNVYSISSLSNFQTKPFFTCREKFLWILMLLLQVDLGGAATTDSLTDLGRLTNFFKKNIFKFCFKAYLSINQSIYLSLQIENIAGKLVFYQMEGNATYVRDTGELASDVLTETTFELYDPQNNFINTKFTYTWDLGNGLVKLLIY